MKATRNELEFTALLTALSAAVGVIVKLAVFFVWHVFWPKATAAQPLAR